MKKICMMAALMTVVLVGCSDHNSLVGPGDTSGVESVSTDPSVMPKLISLVTVSDSGFAPNPNILTASQWILNAVGGTVRLQGRFLSTTGDSVSYDISIAFDPGALPADTTITISIDKTTFQDDGTVTFGPCGIVFNTPGALSMMANNIAFAKNAKTVQLYYLVNGTMQPMPAAWGGWVKKSDWNLVAGASIPHFSRYAFGR